MAKTLHSDDATWQQPEASSDNDVSADDMDRVAAMTDRLLFIVTTAFVGYLGSLLLASVSA